MAKENGFLPINKKEMRERGWKQADFVYVCGDAYVDHPSFGAAIITRLLEDAGYKVLRLKREGIRMHIHREAVFPEDRTDQPLYTVI